MGMRDMIRERLNQTPDNGERQSLLREYLQALILKFIEENGYSKNIAFLGGTALRFIYDLQRFSEDLDFSLISRTGFDFEAVVASVKTYFESIGITVECKTRAVRNVKNTLLKFPELMFENGLTHRKDQKLIIKIDVDTNPPEGFNTEMSFIQKMVPMNVVHFDLPSLFAGKLHAILMREYTKGRDYYDFMWFSGRRVSPNYHLLENALFQTTEQKIELDANKLKDMLKVRMEKVEWAKAADEVGVFLVNKDEKKYITKDVFDQLIKNTAF